MSVSDNEFWKILIVTDDEDLLAIVRNVLKSFSFKDKKIKLLLAKSLEQAKIVISDNPDIAFILLDVVKDNHDTSLKLVRYVRDELINKIVRIVLVTEHIDYLQENEIVVDYEISDYKNKTELTKERLFTTFIIALREYETLYELDLYRIKEEKRSDRRAIEKRITEEKYRSLVENAPDIIMNVNKEGIVEFINHTPSIISPKDIIGKSILTLISEEYHETIILAHNKVFETGIAEKYETRGKLTGNWYYSLVGAIRKNNEITGLTIISRDTTKKKHSEKSLEISELKHRTLINNLPGVVYRIDIDWSIIFANKIEDICGYTTKEINTKDENWLEIIHPEDKIRVINESKKITESSLNIVQTYQIVSKNNDIYWVEDRKTSLFSDNGEFLGIYGIIFDITERMQILKEHKAYSGKIFRQNLELKKVNDELGLLNQELELAKDQAQESDKLKSAFLANMSHEIRTPLNGVVGFSQLLKKDDLPFERKQQFIKIINDSSKHLLTLINDLIDLSKIEAGKIRYYETECQINDMMNELYAFFNSFLTNNEKAHLELFVDCPLDNNETLVLTDTTRLRQILTNLLANATKFTNDGSISFGYKILEENTSKENKFLEFYVKDTGIGIPTDKIETIFERFRQAEDGTTRKYGGTGLGLTISKAAVNILGGKIRVESKISNGSIFYFTIPYKVVDKTPKNLSGINLYNDLIINKKVLIVEDDEQSYLYIKELLDNTGVKYIRAEDGQQAINMCNKDEKIDLVFMDIQLPILNGYEATKEIKKTRYDLPIIVQTAYALSNEKEKCYDAGCDDYLTKPIEINKFMSIIYKYLGKDS